MIFVIDCSLEAVIDQNITASDYSTHTAHKIIFTDGDRHAGTFFQFLALGLRKVGQTVLKPDNAAVRGQIFAVKHMVKVEEVNE